MNSSVAITYGRHLVRLLGLLVIIRIVLRRTVRVHGIAGQCTPSTTASIRFLCLQSGHKLYYSLFCALPGPFLASLTFSVLDWLNES